MEDTRFEQAKAEAWTIEVEGELQAVEKLLARVAEECATQPYEDDTIMIMLHKSGEALGSAWKEIIGQFNSAVVGMRDMTTMLSSGVQKSADAIESYIRRKSY